MYNKCSEILKKLVNTVYMTFSVENSVLDRCTLALQNTATCILDYPLYDSSFTKYKVFNKHFKIPFILRRLLQK